VTRPTGPVTWVVGSGGLLGRAVARRARAAGRHVLEVRVPWSDEAAAGRALAAGIGELRAASAGGSWDLAWCAGAGVVATPQAALEQEGRVLARFLDELADRTAGSDGALFLASSAGGVYAGSADPPFTERTVPRPLAPYGHAKLANEEAARAWSARTWSPVLLGRIANLYGPGQDLSKGQGLVSMICRSSVARVPLNVTVSMDTMRDYLFVEDGAAMVLAGLDGLRGRDDLVVTKVMASGRSTTIGALVGETRRVLRRRTNVVFAGGGGKGQVRDLRLRSVVWPELDALARTTLPSGLAATFRDVARHSASAGS
jgi:UDP-glucose 4-epimerase